VGPWSNVLYGVAATTSGNAVAVSHYWNGSADQTLVERWNGKAWNVEQSANAEAANSYLQGVVAPSATNAFAAGYSLDSSYKTLIEHWDGQAWTVQPSPNPGTTFNALYSVTTASGIAWAVGEQVSGGPYSTVILRWC
jgi:hypothetical protein